MDGAGFGLGARTRRGRSEGEPASRPSPSITASRRSPVLELQVHGARRWSVRRPSGRSCRRPCVTRAKPSSSGRSGSSDSRSLSRATSLSPSCCSRRCATAFQPLHAGAAGGRAPGVRDAAAPPGPAAGPGPGRVGRSRAGACSGFGRQAGGDLQQVAGVDVGVALQGRVQAGVRPPGPALGRGGQVVETRRPRTARSRRCWARASRSSGRGRPRAALIRRVRRSSMTRPPQRVQAAVEVADQGLAGRPAPAWPSRRRRWGWGRGGRRRSRSGWCRSRGPRPRSAGSSPRPPCGPGPRR